MPNIIYLAPTAGAIKTYHLHDVDNDTKSRLYSGPAAVASITGERVSRVRDAFRLAIYGAGWVHRRRSPPITKTGAGAIEETLRLLGYAGQWHGVTGHPTLAAYLDKRAGIQQSHPCIVFLTNHCVAVSGGVFCDATNNGVMIDIDRAPWRRKRVSRVFVLTHRIAPTHIPSKASLRGQPEHRTADEKRRIKERDRLLREAIKAETGATSVKIASDGEVHIMSPNHAGWYWIGGIDSVRQSLLEQHDGGYLRGNTDEAAAYRTAMNV